MPGNVPFQGIGVVTPGTHSGPGQLSFDFDGTFWHNPYTGFRSCEDPVPNLFRPGPEAHSRGSFSVPGTIPARMSAFQWGVKQYHTFSWTDNPIFVG